VHRHNPGGLATGINHRLLVCYQQLALVSSDSINLTTIGIHGKTLHTRINQLGLFQREKGTRKNKLPNGELRKLQYSFRPTHTFQVQNQHSIGKAKLNNTYISSNYNFVSPGSA
jgi:hypothetical protein